jgi:hypothetical protein
MKFIPRFLTDGHAVALGGYVHRVNDTVVRRNLTVPHASAAFGGAAEARQGAYRMSQEDDADAVVSCASSWARAWHEREDGNGAGPTHTVHAKSTVEGLEIDKRLFVDRAAAYLKTVYHQGDAQPTVTPVEAELGGFVIDGVRFTVTLDLEPVTTFGTCDEFHHACLHDDRFREKNGKRVLSLRGPSGDTPSPKGCFVYSLVDRIQWDGPLPAGAEVDEESHVIVWPDFGTIILGEMLISDYNRRLTMMRLELGSPLAASLGAADVQSGGVGLP